LASVGSSGNHSGGVFIASLCRFSDPVVIQYNGRIAAVAATSSTAHDTKRPRPGRRLEINGV